MAQKHPVTDIQYAALLLREIDPGGTLPNDLLAYEQKAEAAFQQRDALREACEKLLPHIHEDNMKGESDYERAVLALEAALALVRE